MSVIVWRNGILAADRAAIVGDIKYRGTKMMRPASNVALAWTGAWDSGKLMAEWYLAGADPEKFPKCQATDNWARLVVARRLPDGIFELLTYEQQPTPCEEDPTRYHAWGSGAAVALGALHAGAWPVEAVNAACEHCTTCGFGAEVHEL